jgi:hypothetical protein
MRRLAAVRGDFCQIRAKKRGKNLEKAFAEVGLNVARLSDPSPRGSKAGALSA